MRVGLVGTGYWARNTHGPGAARHPRAELVGVWGRDSAKASAVAQELGGRGYTDYEEFLDDVDAVTFAVPPDVQAELALRAARRGKHLLLDKPVAFAVGPALELERAVADAAVASIVFFTRRFVPETANWLARVAEAGGWDCGRAEFCANLSGGPYADSQWRREKGALWDVGPHALSQVWPIMGEVVSVVAGGGRGDQIHLILRHRSGASSTVSVSLTVPAGATGNLVYFYGEAGRETLPQNPLDQTQIVAAHQRALDALMDLAQHPVDGHPCDVHVGARFVEVLAAAEQSLATRAVVPLELARSPG